LVTLPAFADEVYLRGGGRITGVIVERTEESVTVDVGGGGILTARMSSVVRIEQRTSPLQEFRSRADAVPAGDAEAWRELARWANRKSLSSEARRAYREVVAILPDDEEANRALGRVRLDGRWVSEEESYRASGYVEFEHQWMTPGERQAILAERRAREEAEGQAVEAQIRAMEAEQEAEKERAAREEAEYKKKWDNLPELGDPIPWAWGVGPAYWPTYPRAAPRRGQR
jgi:hypothetical protein